MLGSKSVAVNYDLFHFTSLETLKKIIETKSILLSDIRTMNDICEVEYTKQIIGARLIQFAEELDNKKFIEIKTKYEQLINDTKPHIISFSSECNEYMINSSYADFGSGVCIKFKDMKLLGLGAMPFVSDYASCTRVDYQGDSIKAYVNVIVHMFNTEEGTEEIKEENILRRLLKVACLYKKPFTKNNWQQENEVRIIYIPNEQEKLEHVELKIRDEIRSCYKLDFTNFDCGINCIDEIVIGPKCKNQKNIKDLLENNGFKNIKLSLWSMTK